jgi:carbonic anhydrase
MCERCFYAATMRAMAQRRTVLKLAAAATAGFLSLPHALAQIAKAPPKPENVLSPDAALERLMQGNARYVDGVSKRHDFSHEREPLRTGQNPFAGILSCADSRIAPEYCFDTARGDIFVCRVAGNFASDEIVASLEYAVQVLNTPLLLVLGHDACGAVDATIKSIKDGTTLPGHLPTLVAAISPAVKAAQGEPGDMLEPYAHPYLWFGCQTAATQEGKLSAAAQTSPSHWASSYLTDRRIRSCQPCATNGDEANA